MDRSRYYQSSGRFTPHGITFALLIGGGVAALLAALYALVDFYNPFIYVNFLGALFLGAVSGFAAKAGCQVGKIRNRTIQTLVVTGVGLLALYMSWTVYIFILTGYETFVYDPVNLAIVIEKVGEIGVWGLRSSNKVKGWPLYGVWVIEAGIIFGFTVYTGLSEPTPFCEACDSWPEEVDDALAFRALDIEKVREELEGGRPEALNSFARPDDEDGGALHKLKLYVCQQCEAGPHYLSALKLNISVDKEGEVSVDEDMAIENLIIDRPMLDAIEQLATAWTEEAEAEEPEEAEPEGDGGAAGDDEGSSPSGP